MEKLLTLQETAEVLGVKVPTLYNWVSERKITVVKVGRLVKFDSKDVREFIEKNKRYRVNINSEKKT
jgi:excisionase family DNA binding protein